MSGSGPNKTVLSGLMLGNIRKPLLKPAPVKQQQQKQQPTTAAEQIQVIIIEPSSAQAIQPTQTAEPSSTAAEAERKPLQPRGNSKDKQGKGSKVQQKAPTSKAAAPPKEAAENEEQPTSTITAAAKAPDTAAKAARPQRRLASKSKEEGVQVLVIEDSNDAGVPLQQQDHHQQQQQQEQHNNQQQEQQQQQQQDTHCNPPYPQESPAEAAALDTEDHGMHGRAIGGVSQHDGDAAKPQQNKARRQTFKDGEEIFKHMQGLAEVRELSRSETVESFPCPLVFGGSLLCTGASEDEEVLHQSNILQHGFQTSSNPQKCPTCRDEDLPKCVG